jgi:hypothetical protein
MDGKMASESFPPIVTPRALPLAVSACRGSLARAFVMAFQVRRH